jgi:hypothetical protein
MDGWVDEEGKKWCVLGLSGKYGWMDGYFVGRMDGWIGRGQRKELVCLRV